MEILLVEDNPADARLLVDLCDMKFNNCNIEWVTTLEQGLILIASKSFNIVILDLGLPDSDGLETLYSFKSHTSCPIVILTGREDEDLGVKAVKEGAQDYLIKGLSPDTLCRSLKYAITRHVRSNLVRKTKEQFSQGISQLTTIVNTLNKSSNLSY